MASQIYLEKDSDTIYEEYVVNENNEDTEEFEDEYRDNDRMDDMISRYGY